MCECHLLLLIPSFPWMYDWKRNQNRHENGRDRPSPSVAIFLLGFYADVGKNKFIFAGNQRTPEDITTLKIKKDTGQGWLKGTIGIEAPRNGLLPNY